MDFNTLLNKVNTLIDELYEVKLELKNLLKSQTTSSDNVVERDSMVTAILAKLAKNDLAKTKNE